MAKMMSSTCRHVVFYLLDATFRQQRLQHPIGEQPEGAEVGEPGALAETGQAGELEARLHSAQLQVAPDRPLGPRRGVPELAVPAPDLAARLGREEVAQLRQQVEPG